MPTPEKIKKEKTNSNLQVAIAGTRKHKKGVGQCQKSNRCQGNSRKKQKGNPGVRELGKRPYDPCGGAWEKGIGSE